MYQIETVIPEQEQVVLPELITLLQDAVASGASVGFLPPLSEEEAYKYWRSVLDEVVKQQRVLLIARSSRDIVGAVQLELATKPNARHRAEVQKLFVFRHQRQHGIGRILMEAIEPIARKLGRTLLVLDTRLGDSAEHLYRKLGYVEVGTIPSYAQNATGTFDATIIFYKFLPNSSAAVETPEKTR
ncbi:MAG: GNAT family N-acetyltransferase [Ktedonobacteraceae bacterium]